MKIAIVGGGWVGCHLANKLKEQHQVTIYEKEQNLFCKTSFNNQNRLHLGYHYPRSFKTRKLCKDTYEFFMADYSDLVVDVPRNYYCVSKDSNIDFYTYLQIFREYDHQIANTSLSKIEGCIATEEKYIDFMKAHDFFNENLADISLFGVEIVNTDDLQKKYDLVINATNNFLNHTKNSYFEMTCTWLYKKNVDLSFDAITVVDGNFFSIYPYTDGIYTVTDVQYTPIYEFNDPNQTEPCTVDFEVRDDHRNMMENKILQYYPEFLEHFTYVSHIDSVKSKTSNHTADRYPVIDVQGNLINTFTGKIQGIYIIEDHVKRIITNAS